MMKKLTTPARKMMSFASGGLRTVAAYVLAAVLFSSTYQQPGDACTG
jgi:hypothetical protein